MRIRVIHQILLGMLFVAVIASVGGLIGRQAVQDIDDELNLLTGHYDPLRNVAASVEISVGHAQADLRDLLHATDKNQTYSLKLADTIEALSLDVAMLRFGAQSEEFKQRGFDKRLEIAKGANDHFSIAQQPAGGEAATAVESLDQSREDLINSIDQALTIQAERANLYFDLQGTRRDVASIAEAVAVDAYHWLDEVETAVKFNARPTVALSLGDTLYGKWRQSAGSLADEELENLALALDKRLAGMIDYARKKIFEAEPEKQHSQFVRMMSRKVPKAISALDDFLAAAGARMADANSKRAIALAAADQAVEKISGQSLILQELLNADAEEAALSARGTVDAAKSMILISLGGGMVLALLLAVLIAKRLSGLLSRQVKATLSLAAGDLATDIPGIGTRSELGDLAAALVELRQAAIERRELEQEKELQHTANERRKTENEQAVQSFQDEVNRLLQNVAEVCTQHKESSLTSLAATAQYIGSVSSSTEEVSQTIDEIEQQTTKTAALGSEAAGLSDEAKTSAEELVSLSASAIQALGMVEDIAAQTNLLALNATIEASRAGDAGRGFAVVASEVKNLASQTANVTREISEEMERLSAQSAHIQNAISKIHGQMQDVSSANTGVASAIEELANSAKEISANAEDAAAVSQKTHGGAESSTQLLMQANGELEARIQSFLDKLESIRTAA